jgi:hypothetical protein
MEKNKRGADAPLKRPEIMEGKKTQSERTDLIIDNKCDKNKLNLHLESLFPF